MLIGQYNSNSYFDSFTVVYLVFCFLGTILKCDTYRDSSPKNENSVVYPLSSCSKPVWDSLICWSQKKIFWRMLVTKQLIVAIDVHSWNGYLQLFGYQHSLKCIFVCSTEKINSYRFGTREGRVNDNRIFIYVWAVPLKAVWNEQQPCLFECIFFLAWLQFFDLIIFNQCHNSIFRWKRQSSLWNIPDFT